MGLSADFHKCYSTVLRCSVTTAEMLLVMLHCCWLLLLTLVGVEAGGVVAGRPWAGLRTDWTLLTVSWPLSLSRPLLVRASNYSQSPVCSNTDRLCHFIQYYYTSLVYSRRKYN